MVRLKGLTFFNEEPEELKDLGILGKLGILEELGKLGKLGILEKLGILGILGKLEKLEKTSPL